MAGFKLQQIPLLFIFLATPNHLPYLIEPLALPLQQFIATVAGFILLQFNCLACRLLYKKKCMHRPNLVVNSPIDFFRDQG